MTDPDPAGDVSVPISDDARDRATLLLAMYKATWDNINRHILVVWQSIAAVFAALGASLLSGRDLIAPDLAAVFVVLVTGWSLAHSIDAKAWYNRNLLIIANIERQFLLPSDAQRIHPFFGGEPRRSKMIEHLFIQSVLACAIGALVLLGHFLDRVAPGLDFARPIDLLRCLPYITAVGVIGFVVRLNRHVNANYRKLTSHSLVRRARGQAAPAEACDGQSDKILDAHRES